MARKKKRGKNLLPKKKQKRVYKNRKKSKTRKKRKAKKRDLTNFPGLKKNLFSKIKQEFHDIDYADKLSPEDRDWLSRFMEEDLGARLNHPGKKIYKKKQDKLECYRRNNKRNWDITSINKAMGRMLDFTGPMSDALQNLDTTDPEDAIIDLLDKSKDFVEDT